MKTYLVGGAIRDRLLGRPVAERDFVVVDATPEEMLAQGFVQVGKEFPVFLHPETKAEYALARTERKTGPGYHGFAVQAGPGVTLEQDLLRRDLTINAIAEAPDGTLIDPYGGLKDLDQRLLRHVSPAFAEDPVRILRVARFAARYRELGFRVAPETMALMRQMVEAGEVDALVPERVWQELGKALAERHPSPFFEVLRQCGALAILFPEIDRLFGVPQPPRWHPEIDTGRHALLALEMAARLSPDPEVRLAALTHDLGKGATPAEAWPSHRGHEHYGLPLIEALCNRFRIPNRYRDLALLTARYHHNIHDAFRLKPGTLLDIFIGCDALRRPARFLQLLLACEADSRGRLGFEGRPYPQAALLRHILETVRTIPIGPLVAEMKDPDKIQQRIRQQRLAAIRTELAAIEPATGGAATDNGTQGET